MQTTATLGLSTPSMIGMLKGILNEKGIGHEISRPLYSTLFIILREQEREDLHMVKNNIDFKMLTEVVIHDLDG